MHSFRSHSSSHLHHEPASPRVVSGMALNGAISIDISCSSRLSVDSRDALLDALLPSAKEQVEEKQVSLLTIGSCHLQQPEVCAH